MTNNFEKTGGEQKDSGPKFEFQEYVKEITSSLDELRVVLDPEKFDPGHHPTQGELNRLTTGITAFKRALDKVGQREYDGMMSRVQDIDERLLSARNKNNALTNEYDRKATSYWIDTELPAALKGLRELKSKIG